MLETLPMLENSNFPAIQRGKLETLQVNLGYLCNQQCLHCHVNAGPKRKEIMEKSTIDQIIDILKEGNIATLDLTGGAPELNPNFRYLVKSAKQLGVHVIDRCNLTVLMEPGHETLAEFLAEQEVEVVASLPCYLKDNVDNQRGTGVYDSSIEGLKRLNKLGYGQDNSRLNLNLVFNTQGAALPPPQQALEKDYKEKLGQIGIAFNHLFTITNMPIKRFGSTLISKGKFESYMDLLRSSFHQDNLDAVMCKTLISVDWQGYLYDCDFNQMLNLPVRNQHKKSHIADLKGSNIEQADIIVADHCYGCTAGQGSSCGGALYDEEWLI